MANSDLVHVEGSLEKQKGKPRLTINLKECRYEIFQKLCLDHLNFRCLLQNDVVLTQKSIKQQREQEESEKLNNYIVKEEPSESQEKPPEKDKQKKSVPSATGQSARRASKTVTGEPSPTKQQEED